MQTTDVPSLETQKANLQPIIDAFPDMQFKHGEDHLLAWISPLTESSKRWHKYQILAVWDSQKGPKGDGRIYDLWYGESSPYKFNMTLAEVVEWIVKRK